ncbi:MAG: 2-C-methyl-D-erythritol 4-phosphate cytidylyltransferase, partial [Dokdonella sp.]
AKQHVDINGRSLLGWTLRALAAHPRIVGVVIVIAVGDERWKSATEDLAGVETRTAIGGNERADSVLAGLAALPDSVAGDAFVLVHDAARPCVTARDIDALIEQAGHGDGGLLAAPLRDTLKRGDSEGLVIGTEARDSLWRALTPQMFRRESVANALRDARDAGVIVTDESMAMERAGYRPILVEGCDDNLKVTTPADLDLAAFLLARR